MRSRRLPPGSRSPRSSAFEEGMNPLSPKDRVKIPRQHMPEQEAAERRQNFEEVNLGLDLEVAKREASRCLSCANTKCVETCPVGVKVKDFIELILKDDILGAAAKIREDNV